MYTFALKVGTLVIAAHSVSAAATIAVYTSANCSGVPLQKYEVTSASNNETICYVNKPNMTMPVPVNTVPEKKTIVRREIYSEFVANITDDQKMAIAAGVIQITFPEGNDDSVDQLVLAALKDSNEDESDDEENENLNEEEGTSEDHDTKEQDEGVAENEQENDIDISSDTTKKSTEAKDQDQAIVTTPETDNEENAQNKTVKASDGTLELNTTNSEIGAIYLKALTTDDRAVASIECSDNNCTSCAMRMTLKLGECTEIIGAVSFPGKRYIKYSKNTSPNFSLMQPVSTSYASASVTKSSTSVVASKSTSKGYTITGSTSATNIPTQISSCIVTTPSIIFSFLASIAAILAYGFSWQ